MGCGQSKIHLYPRKSKSKANGKKGGHADSDAETDEDEGHIEDAEKAQQQQREREKHDECEEQSNKDIQDTEEDVAVSLLRAKNLSLLQSQEISSSQQNFFRMLDRKIDEGPDYDSGSETEIALEEARLNALRQHWESASITASICSSTASRSLQTTPIRQVQVQVQQVPLKTKLLMQPSSSATATEYLPQHVLVGRQQQQQQYLLSLPAGVGVGVSPKRIIYTGSPTPVVTSSSSGGAGALAPPPPPPATAIQYMQPPPGGVGFLNGAGALQLAYYGQAPPNTATTSALPLNASETYHESSQLQQQQLQTAPHGQSQQMQQQQQQPPPGAYYGDIIHGVQPAPAATEYKFPPAISVQRLAPQVQRQLRETQELIKDSCPQLYAAGYGSPGPPIRNPNRNPTRTRPTLETQFSQELS
ncbi:uncharacterized protein Dwil_GK12562 [Drosophila willistoni]|uniref:Uncharacterized protein n=1 Tax=Drosophila willistoni TaxID=7260 RepID=B4N2W0_DROWI|nr:uncharacterized protein Dwil_GK12562 [Drosophila willistoni]